MIPDRDSPLPAPTETLRTSVLRFLMVLGCEANEAEDLAQETLLRFLRQLQVPPLGSTRAWLFTVARNMFVDLRRRQQRTVSEPWTSRAEEKVTADWGADGGDAWIAAAQDCVERLGPRTNRIVNLFYRDGWSREAIGKAMGMRENGVKTALQRARATLRRCIEEQLG